VHDSVGLVRGENLLDRLRVGDVSLDEQMPAVGRASSSASSEAA
jgi:hypothetical protein